MAESSELESFRQKWREEVSARHKQQPSQATKTPGYQHGSATQHAAPAAATVSVANEQPASQHLDAFNTEGSPTAAGNRATALLQGSMASLSLDDGIDLAVARENKAPPTSALDHFEEAVDKEAQGSLGQSLELYRKAYRLDNDVDKAYRNKHFPKVNVPPSRVSQQVTIIASNNQSDKQITSRLPTTELISSFAHVPISPEEPLIEGTPPPPCPISYAPSEIIAEILCCLACQDPSFLTRVALVCKRLAWHVSNEQSVYKLLCQSPRFGLPNMHYRWNTDVLGHRIYTLSAPLTSHYQWNTNTHDIPLPYISWREAYQSLPRIRFTGIYISTVNYNRPGAHSDLTNVSWGAPIHIVTYYRYLRFYPDGTVIALLTTTEPIDIVRHISKENIDSLGNNVPAQRRMNFQHAHARHHRQDPSISENQQAATVNTVPHSIQSTLRNALKGRWRFDYPATSVAEDDPVPERLIESGPPLSAHEEQVKADCPSPDPRDVTIETEGIDPKYTFRMHLSLRSAHSRSTNVAKNTRLIWRSFWSYNSVTDDWVEFGLRHDRPFVFSRVRGWGMD